jgi:hypothetical protein
MEPSPSPGHFSGCRTLLGNVTTTSYLKANHLPSLDIAPELGRGRALKQG